MEEVINNFIEYIISPLPRPKGEIDMRERLNEILTSQREEMIEELEKRWTFDENQQHTHTWHDKQDFLEIIKKN